VAEIRLRWRTNTRRRVRSSIAAIARGRRQSEGSLLTLSTTPKRPSGAENPTTLSRKRWRREETWAPQPRVAAVVAVADDDVVAVVANIAAAVGRELRKRRRKWLSGRRRRRYIQSETAYAVVVVGDDDFVDVVVDVERTGRERGRRLPAET